MPVERPKDFRNTVRRLGRRLRPERIRIVFVVLMASASVAFTVFGPKILGNATDVLFNGVIGKRLPAGMSKLQVIAMLRSKGEGQLADMVRGMSITPGQGVNFDHLGTLLGFAALVYVFGAMLNWARATSWPGSRSALFTACARTWSPSSPGSRCGTSTAFPRGHPEPCHQRHRQRHHDAATGPEPVAQLGTHDPRVIRDDVLDKPVAGRCLAHNHSALARRDSLCRPPFSGAVRNPVAAHRGAERHVEEMYTGHALVQTFGRSKASIEEFDRQNEPLYEASFRAQFLSGAIQPAMQFLPT